MRQELEARGLSSKGLKSQLVARLVKVLKTEQEREEGGEEGPGEVGSILFFHQLRMCWLQSLVKI